MHLVANSPVHIRDGKLVLSGRETRHRKETRLMCDPVTDESLVPTFLSNFPVQLSLFGRESWTRIPFRRETHPKFAFCRVNETGKRFEHSKNGNLSNKQNDAKEESRKAQEYTNFIEHTIKSGVSNVNMVNAPACMPIVAL